MKTTIIMPVYNGASTLEAVFAGLAIQEQKGAVDEILIFDEGSSDTSLDFIHKFKASNSFAVTVHEHKKPKGLSATYNEGMELAKTQTCILMHQDIVLTDPLSIVKALKPLESSETILASYPTMLHPRSVWNKYNFWQKVLFSRLVDTRVSKFTGKFDALRILPDLRFDTPHYRTAGEDFDYEIRAKTKGAVVASGVDIVHLHNTEADFSFFKLQKKEAQLAECYGVNLRRYPLKTPLKAVILLLLRPALLALLFVNVWYINYLALLLIVYYTILYTKLMYSTERWKIRVLLLPLVNFVSLVVYSIYFTKGFIYGKQTI